MKLNINIYYQKIPRKLKNKVDEEARRLSVVYRDQI